MVEPYIAGEIFILQKLFNGDLILQLISLKIKIYLKEYSKWLNAAVPEAKIYLKIYPIIIYGIKKAAINMINK